MRERGEFGEDILRRAELLKHCQTKREKSGKEIDRGLIERSGGEVTSVQGGIAIAVGEVGSGAGTEELGHGLCFAFETGCTREEKRECEVRT